ncbi:MAG: RNA methyltransferase [Candidatus Cloacimonetes bacterium]|nr:RNA methyltransferase [Candidatus Cloacimonadota bacterium]
MKQIDKISKAKVSELSQLKQKKHRLERKLLVLEGKRLAEQLEIYGVLPREQYLAMPDQNIMSDIPSYLCKEEDFKRICDSEHPALIAGLYSAPSPSLPEFRLALYLDRVSDPGNLGTIFRTAAAFGVQHIFLSPQSCEISNPKVVRASMGAVYKVPWSMLSVDELISMDAKRVFLDMSGELALKDYRPDSPREIYILGSEAHGVDPQLMAGSSTSLRIPMPGSMESLNLAISAAILCYHISGY